MTATVLRLFVNFAWCWFFGRQAGDNTTALDKIKLAFGWVNSTAGERVRRWRDSRVVASASPPPFPPTDPKDNEEA